MSKPLLKDPSFWIVAVTLVVAADLVQLNFGVPWLRARKAEIKPAPRMANIVRQSRVALGQVQDPALDFSKKTYPWQKPRFEPRLLEDAPAQVVLIPSEYTPPSGGWGMNPSNSAIGIRMGASYVIQSAYNWRAQQRIIQADPLPSGQFDFIANLPSGALEGLQAEIKKQWGLVADRELFQTNALLLTLDHTNAQGLHAVTGSESRPQAKAGEQIVRAPFGDFFVQYLENMLRRPVINQTGLSGLFDIKLLAIRRPGVQNDTAFEDTRKMLIEQFGLNLIKTNTPVEMLVVKKAKEGNP